jgi:L-lysine 2,3-aminomutase
LVLKYAMLPSVALDLKLRIVAKSVPGWQRTDRPDGLADWKEDLRQAFTRPADLLAWLGLPATLAGPEAGDGFRMLVPRGYAEQMEPGRPQDPLLIQVLPQAAEAEAHPAFVLDPVGDSAAALGPGLLQKYQGRALLVTTPACAMHCRYCFRRHYPYSQASLGADAGAAAVAGIAADRSIREVILSGGDPLMLDDSALTALVARLEAIPHLERLRLHTRLPVVLPSRITADLCGILTQTRLQPVVVIHANHPRELGPAATLALGSLRAAGVTLLNQSVLLRGVNDDPDTLTALNTTLFRHGVLPYYLHLLDRVQGSAHFEVHLPAALTLMALLRRRLPGYLVPRLVREEAGAGSKIALA